MIKKLSISRFRDPSYTWNLSEISQILFGRFLKKRFQHNFPKMRGRAVKGSLKNFWKLIPFGSLTCCFLISKAEVFVVFIVYLKSNLHIKRWLWTILCWWPFDLNFFLSNKHWPRAWSQRPAQGLVLDYKILRLYQLRARYSD